MPDQRPIDLPAALLLATAALALSVAAGAAFLLVAVVAAAGRDAVTLDGAWTAASAAAATVALLILLTRAALGPAALAVAAALAAAWPLTGAPAAVVAAIAIGLVVHWGARPAALRHARPLAAISALFALGCLTAAVSPANVNTGMERGERPAPAPLNAARTPTPRPAGAAAAGGGVRAAVRGYYRSLDRRAFATAWRALSPGVRASFGGFDRWRAGFGATLSSRPGALAVTRTDASATVTHRLVARDRAACGVAARAFSVRWQLELTPAGWRAVALEGVPGGLIFCG